MAGYYLVSDPDSDPDFDKVTTNGITTANWEMIQHFNRVFNG